MRTYSPRELELLAVSPGNLRTERALHDKFDSSRVKGSWFFLTKEIQRVIDHVREHGSLPKWLNLREPSSSRRIEAFTSMKVTEGFRDWIKAESAKLELPMYEVLERMVERASRGRPWEEQEQG